MNKLSSQKRSIFSNKRKTTELTRINHIKLSQSYCLRESIDHLKFWANYLSAMRQH